MTRTVCVVSVLFLYVVYSHIHHSLLSLSVYAILLYWRSQALKSEWIQEIWSPAGSRGGATVGVKGRSFQKPDIYRQFAVVKCFSTQVCCRVRPPSPIRPTSPHPPPPQKKTSDLYISHGPTRSKHGGHVRAHPWLR